MVVLDMLFSCNFGFLHAVFCFLLGNVVYLLDSCICHGYEQSQFAVRTFYKFISEIFYIVSITWLLD